MRRTGHIPIKRNKPRSAARSLAAAGEIMRKDTKGTSVIVFPEGGRSLDGRLQPFLSGGFRMALSVQAAVVPIAIVGTRQVLAPGSINIHGGRVRLLVGDPIPPQGLTANDRDDLQARVQRVIEQMISENQQIGREG